MKPETVKKLINVRFTLNRILGLATMFLGLLLIIYGFARL